MKIFDLISMCLRNLTRRKFRTFLTVAGVVIGTTSIVIMISLGLGISQAQDQMFEGIGDLTVIDVYNYGSTEYVLGDDAVAQMQAMEGVAVATPLQRFQVQDGFMNLFAGRKNRYQNYNSIIGIKPEALEALGYEIAEGEFLPEESPGGNRRTIQMLFGNLVVYDFEDTKKRWPNNRIDWYTGAEGELPEPFFQPMEQTDYTIVTYYYGSGESKELEFSAQVAGIIASGERDYEKSMSIFMSLEDMNYVKAAFEKANGIKKGRNDVDQYENVKVKVSDIDDVVQVQEQIEAMGFQTSSMQSYREEMQKNAQQIQLILAILGGVSLFVSAISITNTMIMSVYERTREIGVMKVLGCLVGNIRTVFLMEAGLIGLLGGVAGNLISVIFSFVLNRYGGSLAEAMGLSYGGGEASISVIPLWLVLLGLAFATLIGLASGFYPANRAVRISALEAIKTE